MSEGRSATVSGRPVVETVAGFTAGVATTLVVHPLDLVKTRLQVDRFSRSQLGTSYRTAVDIFKREGGLKGLYRGISPNLVGNSVSWGLYFLWYGKLKDEISRRRGSAAALNYYDYFLSSGVAGILTALCTNPIWVIKTRMLSTSSSHRGAYSTMFDGVRHIYAAEGLRGFYRGLVPSLLGVSHGALQFMVYEELKRFRRGELASSEGLSNLDYLLSSGLSKAVAGTATYPYQVVRARLQSYDAVSTYTGVVDVVRQTWRREGLAGFYKGLGPNLLRVVPSNCVTFLVYENVRQSLS